MAASIKNVLDVDSTLIEGDKGIFDVVVDNEMVFSKYESGRFPEHDEVIAALRERG